MCASETGSVRSHANVSLLRSRSTSIEAKPLDTATKSGRLSTVTTSGVERGSASGAAWWTTANRRIPRGHPSRSVPATRQWTWRSFHTRA